MNALCPALLLCMLMPPRNKCGEKTRVDKVNVYAMRQGYDAVDVTSEDRRGELTISTRMTAVDQIGQGLLGERRYASLMSSANEEMRMSGIAGRGTAF